MDFSTKLSWNYVASFQLFFAIQIKLKFKLFGKKEYIMNLYEAMLSQDKLDFDTNTLPTYCIYTLDTIYVFY